MKRGEVWLVDFEPARGAEIRKRRPALVLSSDDVGVLPLRVVVPFTDRAARHRRGAWLVPVEPTGTNGLVKPSSADTLQLRSMTAERFIRRLGEISDEDLLRIEGGIKTVLGLA